MVIRPLVDFHAGGGRGMKPVAIYARVSTKEQSTEAQVAQLLAMCRSRGWSETVVFRDDGISGVRDNRPELDQLRHRMLAGEFEAVIVSKMDRLGRSLGMILRFWDDADAAGVRVVVVDQGIDTSTPSGRLQRNMLGALAEFERELILERTQAGIARARALGKKFGAPRTIPESVAREVLNRRARGESLRQISQQLNVKLGAVRSVLSRETKTRPTPISPVQANLGPTQPSSEPMGA
jgi:DNA invertase Pin-like site-specific DNA recombinase